jgi:hypothetical protein
MADAATIASLATAGGTLVLAVATFSATRSANRSARIAERALDLNLRPVLIPAHEWDAAERVTFFDQVVQLRGGYATVEQRAGNLYFAAQLRNVGAGIGVLTSWLVEVGPALPPASSASFSPTSSDSQLSLDPPPHYETFVPQLRSLYVPAGDVGYWQGAVRECDTERGDGEALRRAVEAGDRLTLWLRYSDPDGGHDTVTRYSLSPDENGDWLFGIGRHWSL